MDGMAWSRMVGVGDAAASADAVMPAADSLTTDAPVAGSPLLAVDGASRASRVTGEITTFGSIRITGIPLFTASSEWPVWLPARAGRERTAGPTCGPPR